MTLTGVFSWLHGMEINISAIVVENVQYLVHCVALILNTQTSTAFIRYFFLSAKGTFHFSHKGTQPLHPEQDFLAVSLL